MITELKPIESLTVADLAANPIWEYTNRDGSSETFVRAIKKTPVQTLTDASGPKRAMALRFGSCLLRPCEEVPDGCRHSQQICKVLGNRRVERDQRLFRMMKKLGHEHRLSVFVGSFDLERAAAVVAEENQTVSEVFECLTDLVRKSLVIADTAGQKVLYRLLDLPRAFAREKLGLSGELAMIKRRHAQMWCTVGAAAAGARPRFCV
jgi:hypothetical protein